LLSTQLQLRQHVLNTNNTKLELNDKDYGTEWFGILGLVYDNEKENWRILTNKESYAIVK
jgi:hypothetical protein